MNISEPFIRRPIATALLAGALALLGIVTFPLLPVAPLPQVDFPTISVAAQRRNSAASATRSHFICFRRTTQPWTSCGAGSRLSTLTYSEKTKLS